MIIRLYHSFCFALKGIYRAFRKEPNFRIQLIIAIPVIVAGWYWQLERNEWLWIAAAISAVLVSELFNTAIEELVNLVSPQWQEKAGLVKDLAAGAALVATLFAVIVGVIIFWPRIWHAA